MRPAQKIHAATAASALILAVAVAVGMPHAVVTAAALLPGAWIGGFVGSRVTGAAMDAAARRRDTRRRNRRVRDRDIRPMRPALAKAAFRADRQAL